MKMRKLAMKKKPTIRPCIHIAGVVTTTQIAPTTDVSVPIQVGCWAGFSITWTTQISVTSIARRTPFFAILRQNHARRRPTMSSRRSDGSSVPKRLGHGRNRRMTMSTRPRQAITARNAFRSAIVSESPCERTK